MDLPAPPRAAAPGSSPELVDLARLPVPGEHFVGRDAELARLDAAWGDAGTHVISLVAFGGVGKSALVSRWLDRMAADGWRGAERVLGWSFYSQGTEGHTATAEPFIDFALRTFGDPDTTAGSPHERGDRLARLTRQRRTLLVLDGVEPLQHGPGPVEGRLKDPGMAALLKGLAAANRGLCLVTTREPLADLAGYSRTAPRCDLEELSPESAVELLKLLGVRGKEAELPSAVEEFRRHALTLTLLGNFLRRAHAGDVRKRKEIDLGKADERQGGHAFGVIAAYARWLGEGPELAILRLLGLFDRPADAASLAALRAAPPIRGLTQRLVGLAEDDWQWKVASLREHGLLAKPEGQETGSLDAHPLIRAYFADELEKRKPTAWQESNLRLYEHLQTSAPEYPDTLEEMQPLYAAVVHGCRAGRQQEALDEVFYRRIRRRNEAYSLHKIGAFGLDLTALAAFFDRTWDQPTHSVTASYQAQLLASAGFLLRGLGRLSEAVQPMRLGLEARIADENWEDAAIAASNLSQLTLTLGEVTRSMAFAEQSVALADRSADSFQRLSKRAGLANALYQAGQPEESGETFRKAEAIQAEHDMDNPLLSSVQGYFYCDLLLGRCEPEDGAGLEGISTAIESIESCRQACGHVIQRAGRSLEISRTNRWLLDIGLDHLSLGRGHLILALTTSEAAGSKDAMEANLALATQHLSGAVNGLRQAGMEDHIPRGLLARAALYRCKHDFDSSAADLIEALEIAERSSMRLFECDAHIEWTRLCLQTHNVPAAREHLAKARRLVNDTGYGRREREVAYLERRIASLPPPPPEVPMKDFFVSYNGADRAWAEWIGWALEEAGYSVVLQAWDFRPGGNFVLEMQQAATGARKTVVILSEKYLQAEYTQPEWAAAFVDDPRGERRKLIPLRVGKCSPDGLLKPLIYADLVGLAADEAKAAVLLAVQDGRAKPAAAPAYPGSPGAPPTGAPPASYPGSAPAPGSALTTWRRKLQFLQEHEAVASDPAQLFTLREQIREAEEKIRQLGG
jgi:tetratricopeptide (TPR) repeat protein